MYDPSNRNQQQRRPIPVRASNSATVTKSNTEDVARGNNNHKVRVSVGQIIKSSELEILRGKLAPYSKS
ncbi:MAG: hypothetical protein ACK521_09030 [bacterium]